jgi:hypothetical protein
VGRDVGPRLGMRLAGDATSEAERRARRAAWVFLHAWPVQPLTGQATTGAIVVGSLTPWAGTVAVAAGRQRALQA